MEFASDEDKQKLLDYFSTQPEDTSHKVEDVKQIFTASGAKNATKEAVEQYTEKAFSLLRMLNVSDDKKQLLKQFGLALMTRNV